MTAAELQRLATRLSNSCWCRHWLNYNHPQNPRVMAIQCLDVVGRRFVPRAITDINKLGFNEPDGKYIYTIERTNDDGTPYVSDL